MIRQERPINIPVLRTVLILMIPLLPLFAMFTIITRIWNEIKDIPFYIWCDLCDDGNALKRLWNGERSK